MSERAGNWLGIAVIVAIAFVMVTALRDEATIRDGIAVTNGMKMLYHASEK